MAKVGRPKSDNPKMTVSRSVFVKIQLARLEAYAKEIKMTKTEILTKALDEFFENNLMCTGVHFTGYIYKACPNTPHETNSHCIL